MSNIVDFNKEKSKRDEEKRVVAKRKTNNEKVIRKVKRHSKMPNINVWGFYLALLLLVSVFVIVFK